MMDILTFRIVTYPPPGPGEGYVKFLTGWPEAGLRPAAGLRRLYRSWPEASLRLAGGWPGGLPEIGLRLA